MVIGWICQEFTNSFKSARRKLNWHFLLAVFEAAAVGDLGSFLLFEVTPVCGSAGAAGTAELRAF